MSGGLRGADEYQEPVRSNLARLTSRDLPVPDGVPGKVFALSKCEPYYRGDPVSVHATFESAKAAVTDEVRGWYRDDRQSAFNVAKANVRGFENWWEIREFEVQP